MSSIYSNFIENVEKLIADHNITKAELAKRVEMSPPAITEYLKGRRVPGLEVIEVFAMALGTTPWVLISPGGDITADSISYDPTQRNFEDSLTISSKTLADMHKFLLSGLSYNSIHEMVTDMVEDIANKAIDDFKSEYLRR